MVALFKSLVLPRLEYGCQLWSRTSVNQINAIENIQRKFTKHITGMQVQVHACKSSTLVHPPHCETNSPWASKATDTYKYLGITLNTKGDLTDHLKITKGKTLTTTQTIINLASSNQLKDIQVETIWKLYSLSLSCTLSMITYGSEGAR